MSILKSSVVNGFEVVGNEDAAIAVEIANPKNAHTFSQVVRFHGAVFGAFDRAVAWTSEGPDDEAEIYRELEEEGRQDKELCEEREREREMLARVTSLNDLATRCASNPRYVALAKKAALNLGGRAGAQLQEALEWLEINAVESGSEEGVVDEVNALRSKN